MQNDLAIGGRLKNRTFAFELVAQKTRINPVAVVRDRQLAAYAIDHKGLRVFDRARAGGRVARVSECTRAFQFFQLSLTKDLRDQAHVLVQNERRAWPVTRDNAGALLAAMLQGEKPVVSQDGRVWMAEHADEPALMLLKNSRGRRVVDADI